MGIYASPNNWRTCIFVFCFGLNKLSVECSVKWFIQKTVCDCAVLFALGLHTQWHVLYHKWCCMRSSWWNTESYAASCCTGETELASVNTHCDLHTVWSHHYNHHTIICCAVCAPVRKMTITPVHWNCRLRDWFKSMAKKMSLYFGFKSCYSLSRLSFMWYWVQAAGLTLLSSPSPNFICSNSNWVQPWTWCLWCYSSDHVT